MNIYFDNATTTPRPKQVLTAVDAFYQKFNNEAYYGNYRQDVQTTRVYENTRAAVADFIGADGDEVIFTRNTTEAINLAAQSWVSAHLKAGDNIVLPIFEHHSNIVVWQELCRRVGAELRYVYPDPNGYLDPATVIDALDDRTCLLTMSQVSNMLGLSNQTEKIIQVAHRCGALVFLDCAQSVAHQPLSLHQNGADFAAFSGHKMFASMGIGVLYVRREIMAEMVPVMFGSDMAELVREQSSAFKPGPQGFEAGTPNMGGAISLAAAVEFIRTTGWEKISHAEELLTKQLLAEMSAIPGVSIIGDANYSTFRYPLVSFTMGAVRPQDIAGSFSAADIVIRVDAQCAEPFHRYLGLDVSARVSLNFLNTESEIRRFCAVLAELSQRAGRFSG